MNVQSNSGAIHITKSTTGHEAKTYPAICGRTVRKGKLTHDSATCPRCKRRSRS